MNTTTVITCNKVDIHSHLLFNIDDGSKSYDEAIKTLNIIKNMNISDIVCTPHFSSPSNYNYNKVTRSFNNLQKIYEKQNIKLHLGNEIYLTNDSLIYLNDRKANTLNNTNYILIELGRRQNKDIYYIFKQIEELIDNGYKIVLAHVELYKYYRDIKIIEKFREMGVLIQLDAESVVNKRSFNKVFRYSKKLLKKQYIDIVASDFHDNIKRSYHVYNKAYNNILKKYGYDYTNLIFNLNPRLIIDSKKIS